MTGEKFGMEEEVDGQKVEMAVEEEVDEEKLEMEQEVAGQKVEMAVEEELDEEKFEMAEEVTGEMFEMAEEVDGEKHEMTKEVDEEKIYIFSIENLKAFDPFADAAKGNDEGVQDGLVHIRIQQRNGRKTLTTVQVLIHVLSVCV